MKKILLLLKSSFKFENMIKDYPHNEGFAVETAESVSDVLRRLRRSSHLLLIVEEDTYEMDCLELFLNARDIQSDLCVIVLGSRDKKNKAELVRLGGVYLDSPVKSNELREAIRSTA